MDNISKTNRQRWNALARTNVEYSRLFLDYSVEEAAGIYLYGFPIGMLSNQISPLSRAKARTNSATHWDA